MTDIASPQPLRTYEVQATDAGSVFTDPFESVDGLHLVASREQVFDLSDGQRSLNNLRAQAEHRYASEIDDPEVIAIAKRLPGVEDFSRTVSDGSFHLKTAEGGSPADVLISVLCALNMHLGSRARLLTITCS